MSTGGATPETVSGPPADPQGWKWLQGIGTAFGVLGASATLVFVTGGIVLISRLSVYRLAGLEVVVGQVPQAILVTTGLVEVVAPCAGIATIYSIFRLIESKSGRRFLLEGWPDRWSGRLRWLAFFLLMGLLLWAGIVTYWVAGRLGGCMHHCGGSDWLSFANGDPPVLMRLQPAPFWFASLVANVVFVTMGFLISARVAAWFKSDWNSFRPIALMALVWSLALIPAFVTFDATLPLTGVRVCVSNGGTVYPVDGYMVAETSDAVFIADANFDGTNPSASRRLITIPSSHVVDVISGGTDNHLSCTNPEGS